MQSALKAEKPPAYLTMRRLPNTWIARQMESGAPLTVLMDAAGLSSMCSLQELLPVTALPSGGGHGPVAPPEGRMTRRDSRDGDRKDVERRARDAARKRPARRAARTAKATGSHAPALPTAADVRQVIPVRRSGCTRR